MVHTPLDPRSARYTKCICGHAEEENLGTFQDLPPVPRTGHPHGLEPNPHHRTASRTADTVPDDPTTRHNPQANGSTRDGPQGTRPHCRLHLATHPRGRPPGHGNAHATDGRCQNGGAAHMPQPKNTCSMQPPCPKRAKPTSSNSCSTNHENLPGNIPTNTGPPPRLHTVHQAQHRHGTHEHHKDCTHTHQHARCKPPFPHATVRPQVPPTASHRMPPLHAPAATTDGPTLQPRPLSLPRSCTPPRPLPPLRGPQPPPPRAARGPSRTPPPLATPATWGHSPMPSGTTWKGITWRTQQTAREP